MNRLEIKQLAKEQLRGNVGMLFVCMLIVSIVTTAASALTYSFGTVFVSAPMEISMCMIYLGLVRGEKPGISDTFNGFEIFGKSLWLSIITAFFVAMWSLLFIIPGIVKTYSYAMAPYILSENNEMTASEALKESKRIMHGHKGELFVLHLSFIPWFILGTLSCGLALIYVIPYMNMTIVNFYNQLKSQPLFE